MIRKGRGGWLFVVMSLLCVAGCKEDENNKWGSKYGNENIRETVRDEMIRNGSDPNMADAYTKLKYDEERARSQGK